MSSLTYERGERNGYRLRVYTATGRRSIWLGRIGEAAATAAARHVDEIIAAQSADLPIPRATQRWFDTAPASLRAKLAPLMGSAKTVATAVDLFLDRKSDSVTASTLSNIENSLKTLSDAFGGQLVQSIERDAVRSLRDGLRIGFSTRGKIAAHWRQFFAWCVEQRYTSENPADDLETTTAVGRKHFIDAAMVQRIIDAAGDRHLAAIIALSRFGGLRIPSELYPLDPSAIDAGRSRITIIDPKRGTPREIPIFPELRPHLEAIRTLAGSEVLALSPSGITSRFESLLESQRVDAWPRLWHSMRASRETELIRDYGLTTACAWLGNSPAVAAKHYSLVTDDDWRRACDL